MCVLGTSTARASSFVRSIEIERTGGGGERENKIYQCVPEDTAAVDGRKRLGGHPSFFLTPSSGFGERKGDPDTSSVA